MSWNTTSVWLKVALVSILLATVLFVLGFATNDWMASRYATFTWGLWKAKWCNRRQCTVGKITSYMLEQHDMEVIWRRPMLLPMLSWSFLYQYFSQYFSPRHWLLSYKTIVVAGLFGKVWFRAVQLFECLGLICIAISLIVVLITVFMTSVRKRVPLLVIIICCFAGVASIVIGVVIFATQLDYYDVAWSMGVAIAGSVFLFIAAIMGVIDLNR